MRELIPLHIPAGWMVAQNHFFAVSLDDFRNSQDFLDYPFVEDILQFTNKHLRLTLDLGWYPDGDPNGQYRLFLISHTHGTKDDSSVAEDWDHPLVDYRSRDQALIAAKIDCILENSHNYQESGTVHADSLPASE